MITATLTTTHCYVQAAKSLGQAMTSVCLLTTADICHSLLMSAKGAGERAAFAFAAAGLVPWNRYLTSG
eukprot:1227913-Amphidinium_carterae.1